MKFLLVLAFSLISAVFATFDDEIERTALENPDLFGGDIAGIDGPDDLERAAIRGKRFRWPNATVPYVIDVTLSSKEETEQIKKAIKNYHDNTCIRFVPRRKEKSYIRFYAGKGCYSYIGRTGNQQFVSLGRGCMRVGTIIHEIGHALGFFHEHNRSDRDKYLIIHYDNIEKGAELNFILLSPKANLLLTPFDYKSIMMYGNKYFSKDGKKSTIVARNGMPLYGPHRKQKMTAFDIQRVNTLYNC